MSSSIPSIFSLRIDKHLWPGNSADGRYSGRRGGRGGGGRFGGRDIRREGGGFGFGPGRGGGGGSRGGRPQSATGEFLLVLRV